MVITNVAQTVTLPIVFPPSARPTTTRDRGLTTHQTNYVTPTQTQADISNKNIHITPISCIQAFHYDPVIQPTAQQQPAWNIAQLHEVTDPLVALHRFVEVARGVEAKYCHKAAYQPARHLMCSISIGDGKQSIIAFASGSDMSMLCLYSMNEHGAVIRQGTLPFASRLLGVFHSDYVKVDQIFTIGAFTAREAFAIRLQMLADHSLSISIANRLICEDSSFLSMTLNDRLCTCTDLDCALIDMNACIYYWSVDCDDESDRVRMIPSSKWLDQDISLVDDPPSCVFSPDPRSLLVGMRHIARLVDVRLPNKKAHQRGRAVALPELAAALPLVKDITFSHSLNRELLPDYFFEHQVFRVNPIRVVSGALYGLAHHWSLPFLVALVTIDHVTLIDLRRTFYPLLDWSHGYHRSPPTAMEIVRTQENQYVIITLHAQRQELLMFPFEMNGDACPCSLSAAQRIPSFADVYASHHSFLNYGPPVLAAASVLISSDSVRIFQLSHFGSVIHQQFRFTDDTEINEDAGMFDVQYDPGSVPGLPSLLQPSDLQVPPWLNNTMWLPHVRIDVTRLFETALYGYPVPRYRVDPSNDILRSLAEHALDTYVVELLHFCDMPRSAFDIAYHIVNKSWLTDVVWRNLSSKGLACIARFCFNQFVAWTDAFANKLRAFKVADRLPGRSARNGQHSDDDFKTPVTRCSCSEAHSRVLRHDACCASAHCHLLHDWHFHAQSVLCPQLQYSTQATKVKIEHDVHSMDFSQDVSSLMSFVSQPDPTSQSENGPELSTGVVDRLFASFASDWQHSSRMWQNQRDVLVERFKQTVPFDDIDFGIVPVVDVENDTDISGTGAAEVTEAEERDDPVDE